MTDSKPQYLQQGKDEQSKPAQEKHTITTKKRQTQHEQQKNKDNTARKSRKREQSSGNEYNMPTPL
jgi:hypothetical protein